MSKTATIETRALEASKRYLENKGCKILDASWTCPQVDGAIDIVAEDAGGEIIFAGVTVRNVEDGGYAAEPAVPRSRMELLAALWLGEHDPGEAPFRYDQIDLLVVADGRAVLRHHHNMYFAA